MVQTVLTNKDFIQLNKLESVIKDKGFIIGYNENDEPQAVVTYYDDVFIINTAEYGDKFFSLDSLFTTYNIFTFKYYT